MSSKSRRRPIGCALAMAVMQSDLYQKLDGEERADCDEFVRQNLEWFQRDSAACRETHPSGVKVLTARRDCPYCLGGGYMQVLQGGAHIEQPCVCTAGVGVGDEAPPKDYVAQLERALAECRDAVPIPKPGDAHEVLWGAAIGSPLDVPAYVRAALGVLEVGRG